MPTFASLTSGDKPLFGQKTEGFSFAGTGASVFGGGGKVANGNSKDDNDDGVVEENEHDPHFEPIIPLPELVDVKTGEEDEEEVFKHRAKVYRYDKETKQWKERGVGDIKILKHPSKLTYRVLLRRDQTLKIACNHYISEVMELKPMATSETALIWFAVDYADGEGKNEQLAVKFKTTDTKNDFKAAFEAAQSELKNKENASATRSTNNGVSCKTDSNKQSESHSDDVQREEDDYEDEDDDDDDDDSDSTMFERPCTLLEKEGNNETSLGQVDLRILYDDDVFGARIAAYSGNETSGTEVCNHLIAMQTTLDVTTPSEGETSYRCSWSALDFSVDPPKYRTFVAVFDSSETFNEFKDTFYEGKELAEQSEILENPEGATE